MHTHLPSPTFHTGSEGAPKLVRHVSRPVWGRGVLVRNGPTRRAYQFEDGRTRTFKRGFYHLLEQIEVDDPKKRKLAERLEARAEDRAEVRDALATRSTGRLSPEDVAAKREAQVRWFLEQHPDAFTGDDWRKRFRGESTRRLKRHRDAILDDAHEVLAEDRLRAALEAGQADAIRDDLVALLEKTDLVTSARRRPLKRARLDASWLSALVDLLYGDSAFALRFERWVAACERSADKLASWPLCTAPLVLVHPETHLFVRHTRMRTQLGWVAPGYPLPRRPGAPTYAKLRDVMSALKDVLVEAGHVPKDNLDMHDFVMQTTSTAAKEALG